MRVAYTGEKSVVDSPNDAPEKSRLDAIIVLILVALVSLCYLPVLTWPHWGMFSDAGQIIQSGRVFWQDPAHHLDLIRGYWRPGFHIWDLLLWGLAPGTPSLFYLFRAVCFAVTVCLTYRNTLLLCRSRLLSSVAATFWLCTGATYEVLYTLDKGETYIALIFAIFLRAYLAITLSSDQTGTGLDAEQSPTAKSTSSSAIIHRTAHSGMWFAVATAACLWGMFTKETAQILIVFVGTNALLTAGCAFTGRSKGSGNVNAPAADTFAAARAVGTLTAVVLCSYVIYKLYFYTTGGGKAAAYVTLGFSAQSLLPKWLFYRAHLTEFFVMLGICALGFLLSWRHLLARQRNDLRISFSLAATAAAGAATFFLLPNLLIYVWFPFYALLLPASAYFIAQVVNKLPGDKRVTTPVAAGVVMAAGLIFIAPVCWYQAQVQFQLDSLLQDLTAELAHYGKGQGLRQKQIILPLFNPEQAELGERIQFYIMDRCFPDYREAALNHDPKTPYQLINIVRYNDPSGLLQAASDVQAKRRRLVGDSDIKLAEDFSSPGPGLKAYSFWSDTHKPGLYWTKQDIIPGALFLIPFGDLPDKIACFRGAGWFQTGWRDKMNCLPQVQLRELFTIQKQIQQSKTRTKTMGWIVMEVLSVPAVSWCIDLDGWLENPLTILIDSKCFGKTLILHCDIKKYPQLRVQEGTEHFTVELDKDDRYLIPIRASSEGVLTLSAVPDPSIPNRRPLLLHTDGVKIK